MLAGPNCQVTKGANEQLFCGLVVFDLSGNVSIVEWVGFCNAGKCQQCAQGSVKCPGNGYLCLDGRGTEYN